MINKAKILVIIVLATLSIMAYAQDKFTYDSHGRRDPFIPLIGLPQDSGIVASEIVSIEDVDFQGVAKDAKGRNIVIINGEMLREGSALDALTVKSISDDEAVVTIQGKNHTLTLYDDK